MAADVLVVTPDTDVDQLARRLVSGGRRLVPVVDRGRLVGVVTRRDLLRDVLVAAERLTTPRGCRTGARGSSPVPPVGSNPTIARAAPRDRSRLTARRPPPTCQEGGTYEPAARWPFRRRWVRPAKERIVIVDTSRARSSDPVRMIMSRPTWLSCRRGKR
jgi:hypothetical protein